MGYVPYGTPLSKNVYDDLPMGLIIVSFFAGKLSTKSSLIVQCIKTVALKVKKHRFTRR